MNPAMREPIGRLAVRVYYEDTDFSGVVYHANYLRFLERGRTEFLRGLGIVQADMVDAATARPLAFAVRHMTIDFCRAARMDDLLLVETAVAETTGASLRIDQRILRDADVLVAASVKIALVSDGRARRLPADLLARLDVTRHTAALEG